MAMGKTTLSVIYRNCVWRVKSGREDLAKRTVLYRNRNCRLCAEHFSEDDFVQGTTTLKENVVPTRFTHANSKEPPHERPPPKLRDSPDVSRGGYQPQIV